MKNLFGEEVVKASPKDNLDKKAERKVSLFDYINDLSCNKKYLFSEDDSASYSQFMVNRGMSQQPDLIMMANEMNKAGYLDKLMHHDFYFYGVKAKRRYGKWAKAGPKDKDLKFIMNLFKVNHIHAKEYLDILSVDELKQLKNEYSVGGSK